MKQKNGAEGGIRTPTGLLPLDPEPSASASSATSAMYACNLQLKAIYSTQVRGNFQFIRKRSILHFRQDKGVVAGNARKL